MGACSAVGRGADCRLHPIPWFGFPAKPTKPSIPPGLIMLKYLLVLVILRLGAVDARLLCGIEMITSNMMEIQIKLDCSSLLAQHQECCSNHGVCYVFKRPWQVCDQNYCDCVYKIAGKAGGLCQTYGESFCTLVKETGRNFYDFYGKR
ncbi:unnamed protein product [Heligmosomoides polygyrus]|uniref:DB domain-containing protein n=1 Tax=Heligmosomoides polygyrus TaxID=6339 RepID=A0A183FRL1_HELPZ|nr:unnamed protein product [Heligmosomoides polygyrus]